MSKMQSIHIRLPSPMKKFIEEQSRLTGVPEVEIIRMAIKLLMDKERRR